MPPSDIWLAGLEPCKDGFSCREPHEGESWSRSVASTTASNPFEELDFDIGLEGIVTLSVGATGGVREDELAVREREGACSGGRGDDIFAVAVAVGTDERTGFRTRRVESEV